MKNLKFLVIAVLGLSMIFTGCSKDDDDEVVTPSTGDLTIADITLSRKTDYGNDWIYFSFKDGAEVDSTDHANTLTWDIAFNRYNVRTNGGESGSGQGAVLDGGLIDFTEYTEAPEDGYTVDDTIQIVKEFTGQGVEYMTSTGNDAFVGCVALEYGSAGPSYVLSDHIYVVKTADGKYAKVWIKSYHNNDGDSGHISFKYAYQADGSRNLN